VAKNELAPGQSRVGFAWNTKIREPYPAMLRDRDGHIELVIPFDSSIDELERGTSATSSSGETTQTSSALTTRFRTSTGSGTLTGSCVWSESGALG
jgi:hypothetical protein